VLRTRHVIHDVRRLNHKNREGLPVTREQSWLAVGKVRYGFFAGRDFSQAGKPPVFAGAAHPARHP